MTVTDSGRNNKTQRRLRNMERSGVKRERERDFKKRGEPNEASQDMTDSKLTQRDSRLEAATQSPGGEMATTSSNPPGSSCRAQG